MKKEVVDATSFVYSYKFRMDVLGKNYFSLLLSLVESLVIASMRKMRVNPIERRAIPARIAPFRNQGLYCDILWLSSTKSARRVLFR